MSEHYTYLSSITENADVQKLITAVIVGTGLVVLGRIATRSIVSGVSGNTESQAIRSAVVPESRLTIRSFFDFFVQAFVDFQDSVLGKKNRRYLPFTGTIFLFLLTTNLLGLIPGVPAVTTTVWVNVTMALIVFVYFNYIGIKENGLIGYLKHFCGPFTKGPLLIIGLCLFLLEIFLTLPIRILTLNLRLYWNITGDHTVVSLFTGLLPPGLPVVFYVLGTFVCFMQAFIFTTLTMVYILLATQHQEEEGEHH